ncbi:VOC family protein [Nocardioides dongxiaopingii]|jgi:hypothetical protein|uniref:VOC family protein n=1 Tax=Nocardioides dongxiaopingii TaxID=2576036 RepID=UPI0010C76743|nr:VOC family protein [Nocardioides dongxiaopingii]
MTASWLELCLDVHDPASYDAMASFWSTAAGLTRQPWSGPGNEPDDLVGAPGQGIALCPVPEPRTVKHRVHLDVHVRAVDDLVAAGATVVQELPHWTVLTDPEGGELCAFVRAADQDLPDYRVHEVVVDAADPERIARWWAARFGVGVENDGEPWWWIQDVPGMAFDSLVFQPVPEPKTVKNRIHWDVRGSVEEFLTAGATRLWDQPRWSVLADPEGNEFCVFAPR